MLLVRTIIVILHEAVHAAEIAVPELVAAHDALAAIGERRGRGGRRRCGLAAPPARTGGPASLAVVAAVLLPLLDGVIPAIRPAALAVVGKEIQRLLRVPPKAEAPREVEPAPVIERQAEKTEEAPESSETPAETPDENAPASEAEASALSELLSPAAALNFTRWRTFNASEFSVKTGADFEENIAYLQSFLTDRLNYLDALWLE